jgi:hypothetical protein
MFPYSHKRRVYVQRDIPVLVGSPKVWEHPGVHALKWPFLRRTHSYKNLPFNKCNRKNGCSQIMSFSWRVLNAHANLVTLEDDARFLPIDVNTVALQNGIGLFPMDIEFIDITTFKAIVSCDIHFVSGP